MTHFPGRPHRPLSPLQVPLLHAERRALRAARELRPEPRSDDRLVLRQPLRSGDDLLGNARRTVRRTQCREPRAALRDRGHYHGISAALEFAVLNLRGEARRRHGSFEWSASRLRFDHSAARQMDALFITKWMAMLDDAKLKVLARNQGKPDANVTAELEREGVKVSLANLRTFPCIQTLEREGSRRSSWLRFLDLDRRPAGSQSGDWGVPPP